MATEGEFEGFPRSRDLLQSFSGDDVAPMVEGGEEDEVELNLGLSLGLSRASSISAFPPPEPLERTSTVEIQLLTRTNSLPVENVEDWRKRKEMQSLKRLEAMRKRSERRARERKAAAEEEERAAVAAAAVGLGKAKEKAVAVEADADAWWGGPSGSLVSQGSTSSNMSEFSSSKPPRGGALESSPIFSWMIDASPPISSSGGVNISGLNSPMKVESNLVIAPLEHGSNSTPSSPVLNQQASVLNIPANPRRSNDPSKKKKRITTARSDGSKEMERKMMDEMPCVSTKGDGPNGKRIQGFLYKYRKGEEVRIVCVCHGNFLTPAEFVEHAGGTEVDDPLKQIVMQPNPFGYF